MKDVTKYDTTENQATSNMSESCPDRKEILHMNA